MADDSKETPPLAGKSLLEESPTTPTEVKPDNDINEDGDGETPSQDGPGKKKKRKPRKKKAKDVAEGGDKVIGDRLSKQAVEGLLKSNAALEQDISGMDKQSAAELLRKMTVNDVLTGTAVGGKNRKDMASYKFWATQPVPKFGESSKGKEGPLDVIDMEKVPKEPSPMVDGFEWVTLDIEDEAELKDVYELLTANYVEDDDEKFRFNYSASFLSWALKPPGWRKDWHVGVRAKESKKLVAFISGIPVKLRVRNKTIDATEVNFLCTHKKLRLKRLAPTMIKEITRRSYLANIQQAIYTAGVVLPTPIGTCRYYHRIINWEKLHEIGFANLPSDSTDQRQRIRSHVPAQTAIEGIRLMHANDVAKVHKLLSKYLRRFDLAQTWTKEDVAHLFLHNEKSSPEQVIWAYVVEDPETRKITDVMSFYRLQSHAMKNKKYDMVNAAYLHYYATEHAWTADGKEDPTALKTRLNALVADALVFAKKLNFDVVNALTLMDNPMFLERQRFGMGDGQLNYYLFNYRTDVIQGGTNKSNLADEKYSKGIGMILF
ncbi:MAG: glycylpeptide N-tetradecanoyltransferase [Vezdaea aestivalis]|nr:MAG: glycylpeptide N-tetradecanoyltransferase [Vezdaea aestivalis]